MYWDDLFGFLFLMTYVWARGPGPFETFLATMFVNFGGIIHCAISANFTIFEVTSRRADGQKCWLQKQRLWDVCDRKKGSFQPEVLPSCQKKAYFPLALFLFWEKTLMRFQAGEIDETLITCVETAWSFVFAPCLFSLLQSRWSDWDKGCVKNKFCKKSPSNIYVHA